MAQPAERTQWWKVAMYLDEAQRSMINVLSISADDPTPVHLLQSKLREAQAFLLEIFRWKGLLPGGVASGSVVSTSGEAAHGTVVGPLEVPRTVDEAVAREEFPVDVGEIALEPQVVPQVDDGNENKTAHVPGVQS